MTMRTQDSALRSATARLRIYRDDVQQWKTDHHEAMECLSFEATLKHGVELYDFLIWLDEQVRHHMLKHPTEGDASILAALKKLFTLWLEPCEDVENHLRRFERKGFTVKFAKDFRVRCAEARWMTKPAGEAFDHPRVVEARDAAIDAIRSGEAQT